MPEITYDNVQPLVATAERDGNSMKCTFKCPITGEEFTASAGLQHGKAIGDRVATKAKQDALYTVRRSILGMVRSVMGNNIVGRAVQDATSEKVRDTQRDLKYSDKEKNDAIVRAFERVEAKFAWDDSRSAWVGKTD